MKSLRALRGCVARSVLPAVVLAAAATGFTACSAEGDLDLGPGPDASIDSRTPTLPPVTDDGGTDAPSGTAKLCGNGKVDKGEQCDDGNRTNNDGCSSACKVESAGANDVCGGAPIQLTNLDASTVYTGSVAGTTKGLYNHYSSRCGGSGPDAVYRIDPPMTGRATLHMSADFPAIVSVRTSCTNAKTELGCTDDTGPASNIAFPVFQGAPVFLFVDGYGGSGGNFTLDVEVQTAVCGNGKAELPETCDDGNTNDGDGCSSTCSLDDTSSPSTCPGMVYRLSATPSNAGTVSLAGDTSTMSNSQTASTAACGSNGSGNNATYAITPTVTGNLSLSLLANFPNALLHVRRDCAETTTLVDCNGAADALVPLETNIPVVAEQTVYVFVDSGSSSANGLYTLDARLTVAACGNGLLDTGEECDDGNKVDADGCSASCTVERSATTYTCPEAQPLRLESAMPGPRSLSVTGTTAPPAGGAAVSQSKSCGVNDNVTPDYIYKVTSDIDGWATVRAKGVFNLAVGVKSSCAATTNLACAREAGGTAEETLSFAMNKETPYFIVVDGAIAGQQGFFKLDMEVLPSVCGNSVVEGGETCDDGATDDGDGCSAACILETDKARDKCATAPPIALVDNGDETWGATIVSGTTGLAHDPGVTSTHTLAPCSSNGPDAFFAVTAPINGVLTASIPFATFRSSIGARTDCPSAGTQLACDATSSDGGQEITFPVTQGVTYYLIVDGQNASNGRPNYGRFRMNVKVVPVGCGDTYLNAPEECEDGNTSSGDGCSSTCTLETLAGVDACPGHAVALTGTGTEVRRATVTVDTRSLSSNTGGVCGGSGPEGILVITPDVDGQLVVRGTASHDLVLYARTSCADPGTELPTSCSDRRSVSRPVQKNTPYYVYVDGRNGAAGVTQLQITVTP